VDGKGRLYDAIQDENAIIRQIRPSSIQDIA
jgi:hypothetical protein